MRRLRSTRTESRSATALDAWSATWKNALRLVGWAGLLALLPGCATDSGSSAETTYVSPSPSALLATIVGTKTEASGLFGDDYIGFVALVDLKSVTRAEENWSAPLAMTPGRHMLGVECHLSNFVARNVLEFEVLAGASYQLKIKANDQETANGRRTCDFWVVDRSSGKPVTPVYRRQFTGGKNASAFRATN
jgi:hypothetical protein